MASSGSKCRSCRAPAGIDLARHNANFCAEHLVQLAGKSAADAGELDECIRCGAPTTGEVCAFCRLVDTAGAHEPMLVDMVPAKRGRQ